MNDLLKTLALFSLGMATIANLFSGYMINFFLACAMAGSLFFFVVLGLTLGIKFINEA